MMTYLSRPIKNFYFIIEDFSIFFVQFLKPILLEKIRNNVKTNLYEK